MEPPGDLWRSVGQHVPALAEHGNTHSRGEDALRAPTRPGEDLPSVRLACYWPEGALHQRGTGGTNWRTLRLLRPSRSRAGWHRPTQVQADRENRGRQSVTPAPAHLHRRPFPTRRAHDDGRDAGRSPRDQAHYTAIRTSVGPYPDSCRLPRYTA